MKRNTCCKSCINFLLVANIISQVCNAQSASPVQNIFPQGTVTYGNINYAGDTSKHHLLDVYLPANAKANTPVVIWIHGGAWMVNDKYADMSYMRNTVKAFIDSGYALASIDYRYSTQAHFPAQVQDCNRAIEFLYNNAEKYKLDKHRFALIGFSAGGHLANLVALSNNNYVKNFYYNGIKPHFTIKANIDFYGPADLLVMVGGPVIDSLPQPNPNPIALLLGALPFNRPDLAKAASPVTYIDKNDPPFLIIQGQKDQSVPFTQAILLGSWLRLNNIPNEVVIVPNAPHYGVMFDAEYIRKKIFNLLAQRL
jgi:acetyl esterase/lipase